MHAVAFAILALAALVPNRASAHPHVTVTVKTVVVANDKGIVTLLRNAWTFDEAFSAFSTTGLDKNKDGKLDREELADLAKVNVESLAEYGYFTELRHGRIKAEFAPVTAYHLSHDGKALTLHFTLPLSAKAPEISAAKLEVYDPSFFVAFGFAPEAPVNVEGKACTAVISKPKGDMMEKLSKLTEADFANGIGAADDWASPITFTCK